MENSDLNGCIRTRSIDREDTHNRLVFKLSAFSGIWRAEADYRFRRFDTERIERSLKRYAISFSVQGGEREGMSGVKNMKRNNSRTLQNRFRN